MASNKQRWWRILSRKQIGGTALAAVVVVALLCLGHLQIKRVQRRNAIQSGFRYALHGIRHYSNAFDVLPATCRLSATGVPLYSWRFMIMPFIESPFSMPAYEEPWDGPGNAETANLKNA